MSGGPMNGSAFSGQARSGCLPPTSRLRRRWCSPGGCRTAAVGLFGVLASDVATALAMVLTEVMQNAVEHGYCDQGRSGRILMRADRLGGRLHVVIEDDGVGLPNDFDLAASTHLGLSI